MCALCHVCGALLSGTPGGPREGPGGLWKRQAGIRAESPPPGWHGRQGAGRLLAPPFTAVAQQSLQSPALRSADGVCSTLPHLPAYLSTAPYLCLLTSFVHFSNTVPLTGIVRALPNSWFGRVKLLEEL